jgi:Rap1a immunity proteins
MTSMKEVAIVAAALTLVSLPVLGADLQTGNGLAETCKKGDSNDPRGSLSYGVCFGYIVATAEASRCGNNVYGYSSNVPDSASFGQIVKVVRKWLDNHPEKLHLGSTSLVAAALQDAFPCP